MNLLAKLEKINKKGSAKGVSDSCHPSYIRQHNS